MIELNNVSISRSQRCLLHNCQLSIKSGGFYALTGENGSGKSTLLQSIIGQLPVTSGTITRDFEQGEYAYFPQQCQLDKQFPMTVAQAVMAGLWLKFGAFSQIKRTHLQQVDDALKAVAMLQYQQTSIADLSGGEFQRMLFARMLVQQAPLIILDEPLSAVDQKAQIMLLDLLKQQHKNGATIIITLHDASLVERYATQQLHIREQQIHLCTANFQHSTACCSPL
jgi:zinc/manganese transport system ATP-binding protein